MEIKLKFYNLTFFIWFILLFLISSSTGGLFLLGGSRVFSGISNLLLLSIVLGLFIFIIRFKELRKALYLSSAIWVSIIMILFFQVFLALFFEPPYAFIETQARKSGKDEDNIFKMVNGPSISAASEYVRWMYAWELSQELFIEKQLTKQ